MVTLDIFADPQTLNWQGNISRQMYNALVTIQAKCTKCEMNERPAVQACVYRMIRCSLVFAVHSYNKVRTF